MVDQLSSTFSALADPTRRAILGRLARGAASVNELAAPFQISLPGISKHLKVLERAGLIERGREAQWRPCRLRAQPLQEISKWIDDYRRFWDQRLDQLDDYLQQLQASSPESTAKSASAKPAAVKKSPAKKQARKQS